MDNSLTLDENDISDEEHNLLLNTSFKIKDPDANESYSQSDSSKEQQTAFTLTPAILRPTHGGENNNGPSARELMDPSSSSQNSTNADAHAQIEFIKIRKSYGQVKINMNSYKSKMGIVGKNVKKSPKSKLCCIDSIKKYGHDYSEDSARINPQFNRASSECVIIPKKRGEYCQKDHLGICKHSAHVVQDKQIRDSTEIIALQFESTVQSESASNFEIQVNQSEDDTIKCKTNKVIGSRGNNDESPLLVINDLSLEKLNFSSSGDSLNIKMGSADRPMKHEIPSKKICDNSLNNINLKAKTDRDLTILAAKGGNNELSHDTKKVSFAHSSEAKEVPETCASGCSSKMLVDFINLKSTKGSRQFVESDFTDISDICLTENESFMNDVEVIEHKNMKVSKNETKDLESDDSDKPHKIDKLCYNACYFFNNDNDVNNQFTRVCSKELTINSNVEKVDDIVLNEVVDDTFISEKSTKLFHTDSAVSLVKDDGDSIHSGCTSRSTSSAFESAMSSGDMMSPFGTPSNSPSKCGSNPNKSIIGNINFASLTSENIPDTINKIIVHKALEKIMMNNNTTKSTNENIICVKNDQEHKDLDFGKLKNTSGIKKLLRLTSHRQSSLQNSPEQKVIDKKLFKKESVNEILPRKNDVFKKVLMKNKGIHIDLRELYSSKRSNNCLDREAKTTIMGSSQRIKNDKKESNELDSNINIEPTKSRPFISKIPRLVSNKSNLCSKQKSQNKIKATAEYSLKSIELGKERTRLQAYKSSDISGSTVNESVCCSPVEWESSNRNTSASLKVGGSIKNLIRSSRTTLDKAKADEIRMKFVRKDEKTNFVPSKSFSMNFRALESTSEQKKKEGSSTDKPQYGLAYGKMIRVKTAPLKGVGQTKCNVTREVSRPETAKQRLTRKESSLRKPPHHLEDG